MLGMQVPVNDVSRMVTELARYKGLEIAAAKVKAIGAIDAKNKLFWCDQASKINTEFRELLERVYGGSENCVNYPLQIMDEAEESAHGRMVIPL